MTKIEQFEARFQERFNKKKKCNAVLCFLIFFLGLTSTIYKAVGFPG